MRAWHHGHPVVSSRSEQQQSGRPERSPHICSMRPAGFGRFSLRGANKTAGVETCGLVIPDLQFITRDMRLPFFLRPQEHAAVDLFITTEGECQSIVRERLSRSDPAGCRAVADQCSILHRPAGGPCTSHPFRVLPSKRSFALCPIAEQVTTIRHVVRYINLEDIFESELQLSHRSG